jgi:hypothetical protein
MFSYFQLAEEVREPAALAPATPALTWKSTPGAELSNGGRTVKKTGATGWDCNVLASRGFSCGVHEWAVRCDVGEDGGLLIGVASSALDCTVKNAYTVDGLYFNCGSFGYRLGQYPNGGSM